MIREELERFQLSGKNKPERDYLANVIFDAVKKMSQNIGRGGVFHDSAVKSIELMEDQTIVSLKEPYGIKLLFDENDPGDITVSLLSFKKYEEDETRVTIELVDALSADRGGAPVTVLDVGANSGWYSLNILRRCNAQVYSFEPAPRTFQRLTENFRLNGFRTDRIYQAGLYHENTEKDFYFDTQASGASSLVDLRECGTTEKVTVNLKRMDTWISDNQISSVDFIKCDVEGSELFVYQGGMETIRIYKPIIFSEMLRKWSAKFGYHPNDIIRLLRGQGYRCFVIGEGKMLAEFFGLVDEDTVETNYFFLHEKTHNNIIQGVLNHNGK